MSDPKESQQNPAASNDNCLRCGVAMSPIGVKKFRVGGSSGGMKMLFGELAELGEDMIGFDVFVCPACRKVELRLP